MNRIRGVLVTGRTLAQGKSLEAGKFTQEYMDSVAVCEVSQDDMEEINVKDGDPIRVSTEHGSCVVHARSSRNVGKGLFFMPYGPWANLLMTAETHGTGMPTFKGLEAFIEPAPDGKVSSVLELLGTLGGEGQ